MKTQRIKCEILKDRLGLFYCNLIQLNFVLNMFSIVQICKESFRPYGDIRDDVTRRLDANNNLAYESFVSKLLRSDRVTD